jgi:hypothetical protein
MAIQIEKRLFMTKIDAMDTLSLIKLVSSGTFVENPQERREPVFNQQSEDVIDDQEPEQDDEVSTYAPPADEVMQGLVSPVQQSENEVSYFPLQNSNDIVSIDSKGEDEKEVLNEVDDPCCAIKEIGLPFEGVIPEDETIMHAENTEVLEVPAQQETVSYPPLLIFYDALPCDEKEEDEFSNLANPACYDTDSDIIDNIEDFILVGKRRWDVVGYDLDPIYDTERHFQLLPLQLPQQITFDQWQQEDEVFTIQRTKDDPVPYDFQSYLEDFDDFSSEHLDSFHEDDYQPPLCSDFNTSKCYPRYLGITRRSCLEAHRS